MNWLRRGAPTAGAAPSSSIALKDGHPTGPVLFLDPSPHAIATVHEHVRSIVVHGLQHGPLGPLDDQVPLAVLEWLGRRCRQKIAVGRVELARSRRNQQTPIRASPELLFDFPFGLVDVEELDVESRCPRVAASPRARS